MLLDIPSISSIVAAAGVLIAVVFVVRARRKENKHSLAVQLDTRLLISFINARWHIRLISYHTS